MKCSTPYNNTLTSSACTPRKSAEAEAAVGELGHMTAGQEDHVVLAEKGHVIVTSSPFPRLSAPRSFD